MSTGSTLHCPSCGQVLKSAKPIPAGTSVKCPKCNTTFAAQSSPSRPAAGSGARKRPAEEGPLEVTELADDNGGPRKKKSKAPLFIGLGCGLLLLCAGCGGVGGFFLLRSSGPSLANLDQVKQGMTQAEVEKLIGPGEPLGPTQTIPAGIPLPGGKAPQSKSRELKVLQWSGKKGPATLKFALQFEDDKLINDPPRF
jgi:hypothetical protein